MAVLLLLHVPPLTVLVRFVTEPIHTDAVPLIAAGVGGNGFTVTTVVTTLLPQLLLIV